MSLKYFRIYLDAIYGEFVKQYAIIDDEKIPQSIFTSHNFGPTRNTYAQSIQRKKQENRAERNWMQDINPNNNHDATIIRYIEMLRETQGDEKDIFLVSTDKVLRSWDMSRLDTTYPIVIYPSQLFLMAGNDSEGLCYGTLLTPEKHYLEWKIDGFTQFQDERDETDILIEDVCKSIPNKLDMQLYAMFHKKRFLDLIHNFVIFDKGIKLHRVSGVCNSP